jgi:hypothetical protein
MVCQNMQCVKNRGESLLCGQAPPWHLNFDCRWRGQKLLRAQGYAYILRAMSALRLALTCASMALSACAKKAKKSQLI